MKDRVIAHRDRVRSGAWPSSGPASVWAGIAVAALIALCLPTRTARATAEISTGDLQAIARSLGFLDTLPRDGTIVVGVVFAPGGEDAAMHTADLLNATPGPNAATFKAKGIAAGALAAVEDRLDVLLIEPSACADAATAQAITDVVKRRHIVSVAADPACLAAKCCVLSVHSDRKVEIVLDTALADAAGAHFSSVFAMMVKRQ